MTASSDGSRGKKPKPAKAPISVRESSAHLVSKGGAEPPPAPTRRFSLDDDEWVARLAGESYGGTGELAPGFFAAVRFYRADSPDTPLREVLLPRGRFKSLYDEELRDLFREAQPIEIGNERE